MKTYEATEQAYKNGYEQGKKDAEDEIRILKQKRANLFEILDAYERGRANALKWIPVSERLPQVDEPEDSICEQVQVLLSNGFVTTGWCNRYYKMWWHLNHGETHFVGFNYEDTPVVAWQPLAEPPKGE